MAFTSPAVSSQDAAPITPQTTTGASLLSKEKPLNASPGVTTPGPEPTLAAPTDPPALPDLRPAPSQTAPLPLGPEPKTTQLSHPASEGGPPATRTEAIERPPEEQKLARQTATAGPLDIARSILVEEEEEGIPASQAERETFGYWRSGRSQAKRALEGLEAVAEPAKEEEDVIGGKSLVEPEKITYWRQGRVADPAKFAPAALAALPDVLIGEAKVVGDEMKTAAHDLEEDLDGGNPLVEPAKITYWSHGRVADPASYAPAALEAVPNALKSQAKAFGDKLESPFKFLEEEIDGGKALIEPDKITYWSHPRVAEPAKYAPAALAELASMLKTLGQGIVNPQARPDAGLPSLPPAPIPPIPVPPVLPREAARTYSHSEYSDYRSSAISFHSSRATASSGQKRPHSDLRSAVYSPYL
ncbi:hypothetical protein Q7P35_003804 [Cladosporium inversicolor]